MSDNPKLRDWQGYLLTPLPSGFTIPTEGKFLLPVCTDARRLNLMLQALQEWKQYDDFPEKYIYDHMIDVLEALAFINNVFDACGGLMLQMRIEAGEDGECRLNLYSIAGSGEGQTETLLSGVNLNQCQPELTASAQATTLEPSEPATATVELVDGEFQFAFGIPEGAKGEQGEQGEPAPTPTFNFSQPSDNIIYLQIDSDGSGGYDVQSPNIKGPQGEDGQGIDSVEVTTLSAGSSATAALVDGVLQLGIPRGATGEDGENLTPIDSVEVTTLSAGSSATASLVDGVLQLGIPRGNTGSTGPTGGTGPQGIQGPPGQDGEDCDCGEVVNNPTPPDMTNDNICAGANGVVDWLIGSCSTDLQKLNLATEGGFTLVDAFRALAGPVDDLVSFDAFVDIAQGLVGIAFGVILTSLDDPAFKEQVACSLYCLVKNADPQSISDAIVNGWINEIPDSPGGLALQAYLYGTVGHSGGISETRRRIRNRFNIYARNTDGSCEALCTDCQSNEWEYTFEGATLGSEWELFAPGYSGFWDSFQEYWFGSTIPNPDTQVGGSIFRLALQLKTPLPTPSYITNIQVGFVPAYNHVGSYQKWYADNESWALDPNKYEPIGVDSAEYTIDKEFVRIRFDIAADANFPGDLGATLKPIQSITLSGTGPNPFV